MASGPGAVLMCCWVHCACTSAAVNIHVSLVWGGMVGLAVEAQLATCCSRRLWPAGLVGGGGVPLAMKAEQRWSRDSAWLTGSVPVEGSAMEVRGVKADAG